ncbi:hypothetical protein BJY04DRAFT_204038 [Aspergillus karnatakaensis]|uniref:uncharacterized protein n=1 Tax=Aspergillus karnatakaensis TaxID=1810916 RepID=UPI003CCCAF93
MSVGVTGDGPASALFCRLLYASLSSQGYCHGITGGVVIYEGILLLGIPRRQRQSQGPQSVMVGKRH